MLAVATFAITKIITINILILIFPAAAGCAIEVAFTIAFIITITVSMIVLD